MKIEGAVACAVVDGTSGMCLGTAGGGEIDLEIAAAGDTEVFRAKRRSLESLGLEASVEDITITTGQELHILKTLSSDPNLFFYLILKRSGCNLALAKHRLSIIDRDLAL
jgi:predicted regulator of Ras-like GTPase activity (Roadblock/LC7/MglB family)